MADLKQIAARVSQFNTRRDVEQKKCQVELKKINNEYRSEVSGYAATIFNMITPICERLMRRLYKIYKAECADDSDEELLKKAIAFINLTNRYTNIEKFIEFLDENKCSTHILEVDIEVDCHINIHENNDLKLLIMDHIDMQQKIKDISTNVSIQYESMAKFILIVCFRNDGVSVFQFIRYGNIDISENAEITGCVDQEETSRRYLDRDDT